MDDSSRHRVVTVPTKTRVLVLGTGAMASLVAARLARAGRVEVTIAGTWSAALERASAQGIEVVDGADTWSAPVGVATIDGPLAGADIVIVLAKSYQTANVAPHADRAVAPGGLVTTLQNGLGNLETLAADVRKAAVTLGVTSMGATLLAPARVRIAGSGETVLGRTPGAETRVERLALLLDGAGIPSAVRDDIDGLIWRKLAVNCAINPLSALIRVPNGELLHSLEARATMAEAAHEVGRVAAARGIEMEADPSLLAFEVARRTAANLSSMLQDVLRGAPTEIEQLNGAVVRAAERLGVAVPVNRRLWRAVAALAVGPVRAGADASW